MKITPTPPLVRALMACVLLLLSPLAPQARAGDPGIERRTLDLTIDGQWIGAGVSYGEYHDGQSPNGDGPTIEQVRSDLHIIARRWRFIRMYGTRHLEMACRVIREDKLPIKLMGGAWIGTERDEDAIAANRSEVDTVIRVANAYPDVIIAINVGNETQVNWSGHRVRPETLIGYIRQVRAGTRVPVTTCDDYNFWNKPEAQAVWDEIDFLGFHAYAMWNRQALGDALAWTQDRLDEVQRRFPEALVVHCETGWATRKQTDGQQGELIIAPAGENEQELFYRAYVQWATERGVPHFFFEAFDEQWKGGPHPDEVEKHWGLYNRDRTPKRAMREVQEKD